MLDDLNELRTFREILTRGSLSSAARSMGVALTVVSKRLASLERRTGTRLINRTTRALSATEEGGRLLVDIERALDAIAAGEERLASGREEPVGTLRASAPVSFGRRHVAPVLAQLVARHPGLSIQLRLDDRLADLVSEGLDVAIRIGAPADSSAMMRKLADNRRVLVAAPTYLNRNGHLTSPAEAANHVFLRYGDNATPWRLIGPDGAVVELAAPARLQADNGDVVHDWALAGMGIMLKSELDVADDIAAARLERVLPGWHGGPSPVMALYPSARHLPLKTRVLLDGMTMYFAKTRGLERTLPPAVMGL